MKATIVIKGVVVTGKGKAKKQIIDHSNELFILTRQKVFPGSLNVETLKPRLFDTAQSMNWSRGHLIPCEINNIQCYINLRYGKPHYRLRIISAQHLRTELNLKNGDVIHIRVSKKYVRDPGLLEKIRHYYKFSRFKMSKIINPKTPPNSKAG